MADHRKWAGKNVLALLNVNTPHARLRLALALSEQAARNLALGLARLKQTMFTLQPEVEELLLALNYVLVGDPMSVAAHKRMEAEKGMTPDGGYRAPE